MLIHKRSFDENRHVYFLIKEENVFIKHMEISQKVGNIIKNKFYGEFRYNRILILNFKKEAFNLCMLQYID